MLTFVLIGAADAELQIYFQIISHCVVDVVENNNYFNMINIFLARTSEIGQGLGRILSCGARKPEQT